MTLKTIAGFVLIAFGSMQMTYAMPQSDVSVMSPTTSIVGTSPIATQSIIQNPFSLKIPSEYSSLKAIHQGSNNKLIIHIQDAHSNLSAQENIANAMDNLMSQYDIPLVLSEGGEGDASLGQIRKLVSNEDMAIGAKRLLLEGLISGHEYLNLSKGHSMRIVGIENNELYDQNIEAYIDLKDERKEALSFLRKISTSIQRIKNKYYPKELLAYENSKAANNHNQLANNDTFNTIHLAQSIGLEVGSKPQIQNLIRLQVNESKTALDIEHLDFELLLTEVNELDAAIYNHYLQSTRRQTLRAIDIYVGLLQKAYMIQLNSHEFNLLKELSPIMRPITWQAFINQNLSQLGYYDDIVLHNDILEKTQAKIIRFYNLVNQRDLSFIQNAKQTLKDTNQSIAFLIAGGYHTEHIMDLLKKNGYSYIILTPHIKYETNHARYEQSLLASLQTTIRDTVSMALAAAPGGRAASRLTSFIKQNRGIAAAQIALQILRTTQFVEAESMPPRMAGDKRNRLPVKRILERIAKTLKLGSLDEADADLKSLELSRYYKGLTPVQKFKTLIHRANWRYQNANKAALDGEDAIDAMLVEYAQIKEMLAESEVYMEINNTHQLALLESITSKIDTFEVILVEKKRQIRAGDNVELLSDDVPAVDIGVESSGTTDTAELEEPVNPEESKLQTPPSAYEADEGQLRAALNLAGIKSGKLPILLKAIAAFMVTNRDNADMLENKSAFIQAAATTIFKPYRIDAISKATLFAESFKFSEEGGVLTISPTPKKPSNSLTQARNAKIKEITALYVRGINKRQAQVKLLNEYWFGSFIKLVVSHTSGFLPATLGHYEQLAITKAGRAATKAAHAVADNIRSDAAIKTAIKQLIAIEQQINPKKTLDTPTRMARKELPVKRILERIAKALGSGALDEAHTQISLLEESRNFESLTPVQKFKTQVYRADWRSQKASQAPLDSEDDIDAILLENAAIEELLEESEQYMEPDNEQQLGLLQSVASKKDALQDILVQRQKEIKFAENSDVVLGNIATAKGSEDNDGATKSEESEKVETEAPPSVYEANPDQLKAALKSAGIKGGKFPILIKDIATFMSTNKDNVLLLEDKAAFIRAASKTIFKAYGQSSTAKARLFANAFSFAEEGEEKNLEPKAPINPLLKRIADLEKEIMQLFTKGNRANVKHFETIRFHYSLDGKTFYDTAGLSLAGITVKMEREIKAMRKARKSGAGAGHRDLVASLKYLIKIVEGKPDFVAAIKLRKELISESRRQGKLASPDDEPTPPRMSAQLALPSLITGAAQLALDIGNTRNTQDATELELIRLAHNPLTPKAARFAYAQNADAFLVEVNSGAISFIGSNNRVRNIQYPKPTEAHRYERNRLRLESSLPTPIQTSVIAQSDDGKFIQSALAVIMARQSDYQIQDIIWVYEDNAPYMEALESVDRLVAKLGGKFIKLSETEFFQRLDEFEPNARHKTFVLPSIDMPKLKAKDWGTTASFWIIPRSKQEAGARFAAMPIIGVITALALYINIFDQQILDNPATTAHPQVVGRLAQRTGTSISEAKSHIQESAQMRVLNQSFMHNAKQYLLTAHVLLENLQTWLQTQLATTVSA